MPAALPPPAFACPAPFVHDGDYIRCRGGKAMRLARIDAPDFTSAPRCRPYPKGGADCNDARARASRDNLRRLVRQGPVRCAVVDASPDRRGFQPTDRYGRRVVRCTVNGLDLGEQQLRQGFAVRWPRR